MGRNERNEKRVRYVTKGVMRNIDNILQHYIWERIIGVIKPKNDELIEIDLVACDVCRNQKVVVKSSCKTQEELDELRFDDCFFVPQRCNEKLYVFYDKEKNEEFMMLQSEYTPSN